MKTRQTLNKQIKLAITSTISYLKLYEETSSFSVSFVITDNKFISQLNKDYRKKDYATNVLSFPFIKFSEGLIKEKNIITKNLGEIILSYEKCADEAFEQNKDLLEHITHLTIHSTLHLLGFDHKTKKQAEKMEKIEIEILKKYFKISNPY